MSRRDEFVITDVNGEFSRPIRGWEAIDLFYSVLGAHQLRGWNVGETMVGRGGVILMAYVEAPSNARGWFHSGTVSLNRVRARDQSVSFYLPALNEETVISRICDIHGFEEEY